MDKSDKMISADLGLFNPMLWSIILCRKPQFRICGGKGLQWCIASEFAIAISTVVALLECQ